MYCSNCGKPIPSGGSFCSYCGNQKNTIKNEDSWEYCEIDIYTEGFDSCCYIANAIGEKGTFVAGKSRSWSEIKGIIRVTFDDKFLENYHSEFVKQLLGNGWLPLPDKGDMWFKLRFRRKAK